MSKRATVIIIALSLGLGSAGCHPHIDCSNFQNQNGGGPGGGALLLVGAAIWLAKCGSPEDRARHARTETAAAWKPNAEEDRVAAEKDRAAAESGDAEAQYELGTRYSAGSGVSRDDAEAARWYQRSADQGFGRAQLELAFIYGTGRGVAQDDVQALMWCTLAASGQAIAEATKRDAINYGEFIQQRMTPEQIAEARKRAHEWKPAI